MKISTVTHDYIINELISPPFVDVIEAAYLRLSTEKGSFFMDKDFGSELYRLRRSKDTPQIRLQSIVWAKQALEPLKARYYLSNIDVSQIQPIKKGEIKLIAKLVHQSGKIYTTTFTVKVAG